MLNVENSLLLIVDIQGKLARIVNMSEDVIKQSQTIIKASKILNIPILACEQLPDKIGSTVDEIKEVLGDTKFYEKAEFSSLKNESIMNEFNRLNKKNIIVIGIETHICVHQTVKDILALNKHEVYVLSDAVGSRKDSDKQRALNNMAKNGAHIYTVEMLLFELLKTAKHHNFKDISRLIK